MPSINIPQAWVEKVTAVITKMVSDFPKSIGSDFSTEEFLSVYAPDIKWYDHAFLMHRVGHEAVLGLHKAWNICNQPFRADIKAIIPTSEGAILEQLWVGKCSNDIVRPNGEVTVKASGKSYQCHVCMVIKIDLDGLITRIDEYYNRRWDDGVLEDDYTVLKGASIKSD